MRKVGYLVESGGRSAGTPRTVIASPAPDAQRAPAGSPRGLPARAAWPIVRFHDDLEPGATGTMGHWIELTSTDGVTISAWRDDPKGKPRGGLVVAQEIFGVNSHIRNVPTAMPRTATSRSRRRCSTASSRASTSDTRPGTSSAGASLRRRRRSTHALADVAAAHKVAASAGKVGIVGYCWGGYVTWMSAARLAGLRVRRALLRRRHARGRGASGRAVRCSCISASRIR